MKDNKITQAITQALESQTGSPVFTMRVFDVEEGDGNELEALVVTEDKEMLSGLITLEETKDNKYGIRLQLNYL